MKESAVSKHISSNSTTIQDNPDVWHMLTTKNIATAEMTVPLLFALVWVIGNFVEPVYEGLDQHLLQSSALNIRKR